MIILITITVMPRIVLIEKNSSIKDETFKNLKLSDIYKKCNFRKSDNFSIRHTWTLKKGGYVTLYSRNDGRSGTENKYDLPAPIDKDLYFGTMAVVCHKNKKICDGELNDFTKDMWNTLYEELMGGFEDLNGEDSYSEEEEIPEDLKTSQGYMKDGFVVDSDEEDEDEGGDEEDNEEEEEDTEDEDSAELCMEDDEIENTFIEEGDEDSYKTPRISKKRNAKKKCKENLVLLAEVSDETEESNENIEHSELSEEEYQY